MGRVMAGEIGGRLGETVVVSGWVGKIRDLGAVTFIILRDRSGTVQLVSENQSTAGLRAEDVIEATGEAVAAAGAPGGFEVRVRECRVIARANYDMLPFVISRDSINAGLDVILDNRALSLRNPRVAAIFRVQSNIVQAFREFFSARQFTEIHTPKLVASGTEGGTELFAVDYFGEKAYLAQSPQLYKQMMVGAGFERVYEVGHVYRAEPHETSRHINEYVSLDIEMGFIESEQELMAVEAEFLGYLFEKLNRCCAAELAMYGVEGLTAGEFPRFTLREAQEILAAKFGKKSPPGNLDAEGEKLFSGFVKGETGSDFVFVTAYPAEKRPFYAMPASPDGRLTKSFDLLYNGLEITTGGQRIHDYGQLAANIEKRGMKPDDFNFYLDVFRYGMPPHGGFAIGLERLTMKLLGLGNIREAALLPRDRSRLVP